MSLSCWAIALACLAGCADDGAHVWHADTSFTDEERASIEVGNAWLAVHMEVAPKVVVWDLSPGDDAPSYSIRNGPVPAPFDATRTADHRIRIDMSMHETPGPYRLTTLECVAAHELGHENGLEHHAGPGLMAPYSGWYLTWSPEDAIESKRAQAQQESP